MPSPKKTRLANQVKASILRASSTTTRTACFASKTWHSNTNCKCYTHETPGELSAVSGKAVFQTKTRLGMITRASNYFWITSSIKMTTGGCDLKTGRRISTVCMFVRFFRRPGLSILSMVSGKATRMVVRIPPCMRKKTKNKRLTARRSKRVCMCTLSTRMTSGSITPSTGLQCIRKQLSSLVWCRKMLTRNITSLIHSPTLQ